MADLSPAQRATKHRCRNCYADIVQTVPGGRWRDTESEAATCAPSIYHEPLCAAALPHEVGCGA